MSKKINKILKEDLAFPSEQEMKTAVFLAKVLKTDILFLAPNRSLGMKTPDLKINHEYWEIKTPTGEGNRTIENLFRRASKQAQNMIIDLRNTNNVTTKRITKRIEHRFNLAQNGKIKKVLIITKNEKKLLELKRKI